MLQGATLSSTSTILPKSDEKETGAQPLWGRQEAAAFPPCTLISLLDLCSLYGREALLGFLCQLPVQRSARKKFLFHSRC